MCVCVVHFSVEVVGQQSTGKGTHPFSTPVSFAHSPPSHITIAHFCFSCNTIRSLTHSFLFHSSTRAHFSVFYVRVYCLRPFLAHSPTSHLRTLHRSFFAPFSFCTSLSLPGTPASFTTYLPCSPTYASTPTRTPILPAGCTLPFLGHSPPRPSPELAHSPPLRGTPARAGRGCAAAASCLPLPAPPLLPSSPAPRLPPRPPAAPGGSPPPPPEGAAICHRRAQGPSRAEAGSRGATGAGRTAMGGGLAAGGPGRVRPGARPAPDPDPLGAAP